MHATFPLLRDTDFPRLRRYELETLQVNLGYRCNQTRQHCHANAGPTRKEMMGAVIAARAAGTHVVDRCNLTVLAEAGQEGLDEFLAQHRVEVVASLPCYANDN